LSHHSYTSEVSTDAMAISLELAALLLTLCSYRQPDRVLDLGSGFSSVVLRKYAQEAPGSLVVTIDDDAEWLHKTRQYLEREGLPFGHLYSWDEFYRRGRFPMGFDVVLHDLGSMDTRLAVIPKVADLVATGGLLILDDFHKRRYRRQATSLLKARGFKVYSVRRYSLDYLHRFAALAVPRSTR
jgi:predicted O-methyltransferase YrrM